MPWKQGLPWAPYNLSATPGNGQATVSFSPPSDDGGNPITSYTITSSPGNITATGATSPVTVTGLTDGISYTFTVTAINSIGIGKTSHPSNSVIPRSVPGIPTGVMAVPGNGQATISFTAPASNGSKITAYTVTSSPGNIMATGTTIPITIFGLTNRIAYTFTATASNAIGMGSTSAPSNLVMPTATACEITRVSVDSLGNQGDGYSGRTSISADGRYATFTSGATNLVAGDTNGTYDVFVHDRQTGQTTRVSVDSSGNQANNERSHITGQKGSGYSSISADGRYISFSSYASNLVAGDTNEEGDVFVHDRQTSQTTRVSVDTLGNQANNRSLYPSISADGRYVSFSSIATNLLTISYDHGWADIFVHDRQTGQTTCVSLNTLGREANGDSGDGDGGSHSVISADGRYVTFSSTASNIVGGDTNEADDIFVHDRQTGQTTRVSVDSSGHQANADSGYGSSPSISADGRYVTFRSTASNLVGGDTNSLDDIFVHDRQTRQTTRVSVDSSGNQATGHSYSSFISADGRYVTFSSGASNIVPGDTNKSTDVFVHDRQTGQTARVSVNSSGNQENKDSAPSAISVNGRYVAVSSSVSILVAGDTNGNQDVFVYDFRPDSISVPIEAGSNVAVTPTPAMELNFNSVTIPGTVEVQSTTEPGDISIADNTIYSTVPGTSYEIFNTAGTSGMATVCISYDPANIAINGDSLRLMHHNGASWVDITTSVDTLNRKVCGQTESFSPFVIAYPVTAQISASTGSFVYSRATKLYTGNITLTNKGTDAVTVPVAVALNGLTSGVTLVNALGIHNGAPYITIANNGLAAGASLTIPVRFSNLSNAKINFTPVTFQE
jgi:hypothetical protein